MIHISFFIQCSGYTGYNLKPDSSYTPTLFAYCVSPLEAWNGKLRFCRWTKNCTYCSQHPSSSTIDYFIGLLSLKQSLYWFTHTDVPSFLCSAQCPGGTHHRLFIWRLPAGHGRRPAETASRHLSAGVCQARQETGVSHSNLLMQCCHQTEPGKRQKGERGAKHSPNTTGTRIQFLAVAPSACIPENTTGCAHEWEGSWGLCPCCCASELPLVIQVPAQEGIWKGWG